ncbi:MAG: tetratricopeptide repeat protein [Planctomycetota bacterium]
MPIRIECSCGKVLNVPDTMAGQKGKCPGCGAVLTVPKPGEAGKEEAPQWKYRGPDVSVMPLIMGVVVFILLLAGGVIFYIKKTGSPDATYQEAMENIQRRKFYEAKELLDKIIAKDPKHVDAYVTLGVMALDSENYKEAEEKLKKALEIKPDYPRALERLGETYLRQDNVKKAQEVYGKLKAVDEKLAQSLLDSIKIRTDPDSVGGTNPTPPGKDAGAKPQSGEKP